MSETILRRRSLLRSLLAVLAVGLVAWLLLRWTVIRPPVADVPLFSQLERPLLIAHQGGEGLRPGNTMEAFLHAWELGALMSETDLHTTRDGYLVMIHDDTVEATTSGRGAVRELTLAELRELDAGYHWTPDGGATFPYRGAGVRIPTLAELLEAFPDGHFNLELKQVEPSLAGEVCEAIREAGIQDRTLAASFSTRALREFRRECPEVATSAGAWEARAFLLLHHLRLSRAWTPPFEAIQLPPTSRGLTILTPRLLRTARERNVEVHAWTINEAEEMARLLELGVDGIVTDFPDRMLDLLDRGAW